MVDATGKKLLRLLQSGNAVELRSAAARVLGELGLRDAEVSAALCAALGDPDPDVRTQALTAAGKLRVEQALPQLLERVGVGGAEAEVAAQAAARLGPKGTKALKELMTQVAPGLRRRIAAALGAGGTASAGNAAIDALLDTDAGVVDAAARGLLRELPSLPEPSRRALADHALELLTARKTVTLSPASETALIRLLAAVADPRAEAVFWSRLEPAHPPEVRAAALSALGAQSAAPAKDRLRHLLVCAGDRDFRIAAPALMILKSVPVNERVLKEWLPLFDAPDPAVRRFAIEKLGTNDSPAVAGALLRQLDHPDRGVQHESLACLTRLAAGRKALVEALQEAPTPEAAWSLARAQAPFFGEYPAALRQEILSEACTYLEAGDRRAEPLLFLLREGDPRGVRDQLEERAAAFRKKKAYEKALIYLRLLARDPACAEAIRFDLAACGLKVSEHDLAADTRAADPCLQQFARLVHSHETDPAAYVKQAKWLAPEDLFYLGFHFVEGNRREQEFGAAVLRLVIERSARSKLGKDAKSKLRGAGFD